MEGQMNQENAGETKGIDLDEILNNAAYGMEPEKSREESSSGSDGRQDVFQAYIPEEEPESFGVGCGLFLMVVGTLFLYLLLY